MAEFAIKWDQTGDRVYETGVDHGVLYPVDSTGAYQKGVAWNGLTQVSEQPEGAEPTDLYADNIKYLTLMSTETFKATIEAYTYPDEFAICNGEGSLGEGVVVGQQKRSAFGLCYRTKVGNDVDPEKGYKIHLIYGALASPSERAYATVNDSPEAITFSWSISTTPVEVTGMKPTASLTIDSTKCDPDKLAALEALLYGVENGADASLPLPDEILALLNGKEVSSIAITSTPTKTTYTEGESFDATGMVVTATYADATSEAVTGYTVTPNGALATTDTSVTITYKGKTATQVITVEAAQG